jgi:hypothetical protein
MGELLLAEEVVGSLFGGVGGGYTASSNRIGGDILGDMLGGGNMIGGDAWSVEKRFRVTEVFLGVLWVSSVSSIFPKDTSKLTPHKCCASAYLSFYFTDCLMSRWLLNYTPQATLVRLLTINALNAYITSWVLYLSGGSEDPRLLLPAWISIATVCGFSP